MISNRLAKIPKTVITTIINIPLTKIAKIVFTTIIEIPLAVIKNIRDTSLERNAAHATVVGGLLSVIGYMKDWGVLSYLNPFSYFSQENRDPYINTQKTIHPQAQTCIRKDEAANSATHSDTHTEKNINSSAEPHKYEKSSTTCKNILINNHLQTDSKSGLQPTLIILVSDEMPCGNGPKLGPSHVTRLEITLREPSNSINLSGESSSNDITDILVE